MPVDLEPFKTVMNQNILKIISVGGIIIGASLLFKKLEKRIKKNENAQKNDKDAH